MADDGRVCSDQRKVLERWKEIGGNGDGFRNGARKHVIKSTEKRKKEEGGE